MNKVFLTGNLTADPKKETVGEKTLATFTIAVNEGEKVSFIDCKAWGGWGENLKARKGAPLVVEGRLAQERWSDKSGGNHSRVVVTCDSVREITKRAKEASPATSEPVAAAS
jgi:single stranded DNA-binding protein